MSEAPVDFSNQPNQGIEFGNQTASTQPLEPPLRLILASYNIRYAVGRYLIASGVLRKVGYNFPRDRARGIASNIQAAARALTQNNLLPRPDILALQEADKATGRAVMSDSRRVTFARLP